jgi:hypothetical protein
MSEAIMIRVTAENFDKWRSAHDSQEEARKAYGMTDGPFYTDEKDSNVALVQLNVEDMDRAKQWFGSDAFKQAAAVAAASGTVDREIWFSKHGAK